MRIGLIGIATFFLIFFLIIINSSNVPSDTIDSTFETIDQNTFDQNFSTDTNLSKFIKYTGEGIAKELHGTYYLAAWLNTFLPTWVIENKELLAVLAILALSAPILAVLLRFTLLITLAIILATWGKIKKRRQKKAEVLP